MTHVEKLRAVEKVFLVGGGEHTPCNGDSDDDDFEEAREECMSAACDVVDEYAQKLGGAFAREQAILVLLHETFEQDGGAVVMATLQELVGAAEAWLSHAEKKANGVDWDQAMRGGDREDA